MIYRIDFFLLKFFISAAIILSLASCSHNPEPKEYRATYDFLKSSSSVEKKQSMREQRNIAFEKAKYSLKEQVKKEVTSFLSLYLDNIGLKNQKQIEKLCEYVNMDINTVFDEVSQQNIEIIEDGVMKLTVTLDKDIFLKELKKSIQTNFERERAVWERFQEQKSQDLMNSSLEKLVYSKK